jgi:methyl-accepting chemotaxis protein
MPGNLADMPDASSLISPEPPPDGDALHDLLGRWLALGAVQRRAFLAMTEEIGATSHLIEDSTATLTARFRDLARSAVAQAERVRGMAAIAREVEVGGTRLATTEVVTMVETAVVEASEGLRRVSGQAGAMVQALDTVVADMAEVEKLVAKIEEINTKARYVALNAAIEAHRGEGGDGTGGAFKVIAHELKDLSLQTDAISRQVRERVGAIAGSVRAAHARLRGVAGSGTGAESATRAQLDAVLAGLMAQNAAMTAVLAESSAASDEIAETVSGLVTGAQFQDRASQHLAHVADALETVGAMVDGLGTATRAAAPGIPEPEGTDRALIDALLDGQTLSAVRRRFLDRLQGGQTDLAEAEAAGDVELF